MKNESAAGCRSSIRKHIANHDFDVALMSTYDTRTGRLVNWYTASGISVEKPVLNDFARRMAQAALDSWAVDAETCANVIELRPRKRIVLQGVGKTDSCSVIACVSWPNPEKPLFLHIELLMSMFGIAVQWHEGEPSERGPAWWMARLVIGPIGFKISGDK